MVMKAERKTPHSELMKARHDFIKLIRDFYYASGYLEVETPNLMKTAAPDPNIEPLKVYINDKGPFFLHTSPEMGMKKLLQSGTNVSSRSARCIGLKNTRRFTTQNSQCSSGTVKEPTLMP